MAVVPEPFESSSFIVDIGTGESTNFLRVEFPNAMIDELAYRSGSNKTTEARKQPGLAKYDHVVLKRGLMGSTELWDWWKQAREAQKTVDRDVTVTLLDSEHNSVWRWRFRNAFPVNYHTTALDATSSDILIEELTLTFDSMDIEQ